MKGLVSTFARISFKFWSGTFARISFKFFERQLHRWFLQSWDKTFVCGGFACLPGERNILIRKSTVFRHLFFQKRDDRDELFKMVLQFRCQIIAWNKSPVQTLEGKLLILGIIYEHISQNKEFHIRHMSKMKFWTNTFSLSFSTTLRNCSNKKCFVE